MVMYYVIIKNSAYALRKASCSPLDQDIWHFGFADEATDELNDVFGTYFGRKLMTLQEIKKV